MPDPIKVEDVIPELERHAPTDAAPFFHPPVEADKLKVTGTEVKGPFAFVTVQSPRGLKVILRYAWRTKQLLGPM